MGVQNLWLLLAPVGRQIELESLCGHVLAVDASIWLTQFIKAMRDDEGKMIRHAHLLGTFHRVAKLLFYGIRPVFVFDGETPEIKKKTTARRRKRQEQQTANYRHTAQRLLLNRLKQWKQHDVATKRDDGPLLPAAAPGFTLPAVERTQATAGSRNDGASDRPAQAASPEPREEEDTKDKSDVQLVWTPAPAQDEADDLSVEEIELDTSHGSKIDLDAVFSLPPHLQKDMIHKILRDRRQHVRNQFIPLAGKPAKYSQVQLAAFLQTSALNRRIEAAKRHKQAMEMAEVGGREQGARIDSNASRFYFYEKGATQDREQVCQDKEERLDVGHSTEFISKASTDDRLETCEVERKQTQGMQADESVHPMAKEVVAAWIARHHVRAKQEPMLAIEKFRRHQREKEQATVSRTSAAPLENEQAAVSVKNVAVAELPQCDVSVSLNMEEMDSEQMVRFQQMFPASATPNINQVSNYDDDDDVEWEEVAISADREIAEGKGSHEAVENVFAGSEVLEKKTSGQDGESGKEHVDSKVKKALDGAEDSDELFVTLRDEMEDAKGHEDLELLKQEALQSAMVTASNLTQWAAGAVRRALEAHSLQHNERHGGDSAEGKEDMALQGTASVRISLSDGENDDNSKPDVDAEHVEAGGNEEKVQDNEEQLRAALAASIASETEEAVDPARVRYLHYSRSGNSPSTDTLSVQTDVAALQMNQHELIKLRNRQLRDTEGLTDEMVSEVMALLRLFGVPFLVSPMEAEAQCATLEQLGLVDGIITDDSDIFPFGGQRVYKNIFHHHKFVEAFYARDIERELGFSREQLIALALLLGSDYTDGVHGIGIVNASEIVAAYPGIEGLREFKDWVREFHVAEEAERVARKGKKKKNEENKENGDDTVRTRFQRSHASARRRWEVGDEFPNKRVVQAYMAPQVDRSDARFSWSAPDFAALRQFCVNAFGWDEEKSEGVLQPLIEKAQAAAACGRRHVQTRLDAFVTRYDDQVHYARIRSKRLRSAIAQGNANKSKKLQK
ncbi:hypothetical protein PsorP6_014178 [Peronosclerospora sorghi]|uniref:Uncharacterized protein n=1 Tax=Peronosclerospora sorghi TaxID=230839 RepID=A0ACC0VI72_9STRA|nr:hypothetical protein PsorP6_014178 [Peronosclerospora sorghi]